MNLDLRRYLPLAERHTLALFSLTTLTTGTVGEDIASWQVFALGGTNTIRGWELGAREGKNQFINTIEYRYELMTPRSFRLFKFTGYLGLQIAVFGDVGSAWNTRQEFETAFIGGGGVGVRLIMPFVGMIRFDLGGGESGLGLQVHIADQEKAVKQRARVR
jgi:outer membrane protein assembly factor BamA